MKLARRPFGRERVPILSGTEAAAFDRHAIDSLGVPSQVLIEAAGRAAAAVVDALYPHGIAVVLAGKGNNGADAVVVARTLLAWGRDAILVPVGSEPDPTLLHGWKVPVVELAEVQSVLGRATVVVDGILGTGLRGAPRGAAAEAITLINRHATPVVALDIPSGIDADSGEVFAPAIRAAVTIGFGAAKLGGVLFPAREHVGRSVVVEIGFPPMSQSSTSFVTPEWASLRLPVRTPTSHKNSVGAVCLVAGREGMAGAAVLASQAALRAGAGYVRVVSAPSNREILQAAVPEAVFVDRTQLTAVKEAVRASKALLVGPGVGTDEESASTLKAVLEARGRQDDPVPLVLDADALTLLGEAWKSGEDGVEALEVPAPALLTPHPGEMARLVGNTGAAIASDPLGVARGLAAERGVAVLLKGAPTVVASPGGAAMVAGSQSSDLAAAGMGDTLAGTVASLIAQGLSPVDAAGVGLEITARAGTRSGLGAGLTPSDVIANLAGALRERGSGDTDLALPFVLFDQDPPR